MNEAFVSNDMHVSMSWIDKAKSIIESLLPGWKIVAIEGKDDEICRILDINCGIDYLLCSQKSSLAFGLASRVQYDHNYRTFSIRSKRDSGAKTEYEKRKVAIAVNALIPIYTMQIYIEDNQISGLAIAKTIDILEFIERGYAIKMKTSPSKKGQAEFYVCEWDMMKSLGYTVLEYDKQERSDNHAS